MVKKIKRKKKKRYVKSNKDNLSEELIRIYEERLKELYINFETAVNSIPQILHKYSVKDIATSLFVSHLWLPNISSNIKHQFLLSIFTSMKPEGFSKDNKINSYNDFKKFLKQIYPLLPNFFMLEDYIPEPDWGEIKFFHNDQIYKIFYGQELSNVYDYLILFQMLYVHLDKEYFEISERSPSLELQNCLRLQDEIISNITSQPSSDALNELLPGHIEIPPQNFWENAMDFYNKFNPQNFFEVSFLNEFSINLGEWSQEYLNADKFQELVHRGRVVPKLFIYHEGHYFLVLPRRCSAILFDSWATIYERYHETVIKNDVPYSILIGRELYHYIRARVNCSFLKPFVSAVFPDGTSHDIFFSTAFISKDRLILFYVTNPAYSKDQIEQELEDITPKLNDAINLINSSSPVTLALPLSRKIIQFTAESNEKLKPELFVVVPYVSTDVFSFSIPKTFRGDVIFIDHLLGIIDELDDADSFASFIEYREEYNEYIQPDHIITPLDIFGSFKDSAGILIEDAADYNLISIDPHWGSHLRYKTLLDFWKIYPDKHFFDHPRSWRVKKETETRVRLEARGYLGVALYCRLGRVHVFLNAPFDSMSYEQGLLTNLLMECLEDSLSLNKTIIEKHQFFKTYDQFQVLFFPHSLVESNDKFKHLKHLNPQERYWQSDYMLIKESLYGIRLVFNDKLLSQALAEVKDRSIEISLLLEILNKLDEIIHDSNINSIKENLNQQISNKPRFKIFTINKEASFPQFVNPHKPSLGHFKRAKKKIAELAKQKGLTEGHYTAEEAKEKLNTLRDAIVAEINCEVNRYDFNTSIPYLLSKIDALTDEYKRKTIPIKFSIQHDVDYDRAKAYAEHHSEYIRMSKNYQYLIEKFVQLEPHGTSFLDKDSFQYLIALIDWLHVIYSASDSLHYGINPVGMEIDKNFLINIKFENDFVEKEKIFAEEEARISLGLMGNPDDKVSSPRPIQELVKDLDNAFESEFHFKFSSMIRVLKVLANWVESGKNEDMNPFYFASLSEIEKVCCNRIDGIKREEIKPIIEFLTLKKNDILHIIGQDEPCSDLPVWEHRKRFARYTLRPLILVNDKYYWGPYSAMKSGLIWTGNLSYGTLPIDLESTKIQDVIENEKRLIEEALEDKAFEIVRRYTEYVRKRCELHKINSEFSPPHDLGDYDILAFISSKNVILNIECKDILPVYCLKDAKRLREKIFGRPGKDRGHLEQIEKRQQYLSENIINIANFLEWPIDLGNLPRIITIYLTRLTYWWTMFPPIKVNIIFLRVEMLSQFIEKYNELIKDNTYI